LVLAAAGVVTFSLLLASWSAVESVSAERAQQAFARALAELDDDAPYVTLTEDGVAVDRSLEGTERSELANLVALVWEPDRGRLVRVAFPYWFVRVKTTDSLNLGTLIAAASRDWRRLKLSVSVADLERRGPGLVLDHTRANGARVLLWSEAAQSAPR